ncbi:MAG: carboxypeptidase-like regulatory domain-containing protein [Acidobacteriota bacterium]
MSDEHERTHSDLTRPWRHGLTRWQWWSCLGVGVVGFFLLTRRDGEVRWNPLELWDAILWSYLPLPLLILLFLYLGRRLSWPNLLLGNVELLLAKFTVTFLMMTVIWAVAGPPGDKLPRREPSSNRPPPSHLTPPSSSDTTRRVGATVQGRVVDATGQPVTDAAVWLVRDEDADPRPDPTVRVLEVGENGLTSSPAVVTAWQELSLRSRDGQLHTLQGRTPEGRVVFNFPVLPSEPELRSIRGARGWHRLSCTVHADEPESWLLVLDHLHGTAVDAAGRFELTGLPGGRHWLRAERPEAPHSRVEVQLQADDVATVALALPAP